MDIIYEKIRDNVDDELVHVNETSVTNKIGNRTGPILTNPGGKESQQARRQQQQQPPSPQSTSATSPPPSSSTSPSHEFSFTISINPSSTQRTPQAASSFAVDLSPADDIFFHGHLLPLHLLSHLPLSPRSSTNSLDSLTFPINDHNRNQNQTRNHANSNTSQNPYQRKDQETKTRTKSKSFSLFGLPKRRKSCEVVIKDHQEHDHHHHHHQKHNKTTKLKFDVSNVLKRYLRMVRPLLSSFRNSSRRENNNKMQHFHKQAYSFSGNTSFRDDNDDDDEKLIRGKRIIQYSAPASMRTSPNNSGPLVGNNGINLHSSTSDSTMEELQAAIQAAIAHCKNSISMEDKKKTVAP